MTTHERNPDGGVYDIPRDAGAAAPSDSSAKFAVGDIVSPQDRGNIGEVVAVEAERIRLRFVDRQSGTASERFFAPAELTLVKGCADITPLKTISFDELVHMPPAMWLLRGILRAGELACIFGPPGTGKTFIALDIALCIGAHMSWHGTTAKFGGVLYIAGEGVYSISLRAKAWLDQFQDRAQIETDLQENFVVLGDAVSFMDGDFEKLMDLVQQSSTGLTLIVVDTLARCMFGGDENSAEDMGTFVRNCDRLRKKTGATVLVVHHSGKGNEQNERGSSALRGACDAMFIVAKADGKSDVFELKCDKQKEGAPFGKKRFELKFAHIGFDEDGEALTSGRLELLAATAADAKGDFAAPEDKPLDVIQRTLAQSFFEDGASGTELKGASGITKTTFHRHLKNLVDEGLVERFGRPRNWRYKLTAESQYFEETEEEDASVPSPSPTSPTQSQGTQTESDVESQVPVPSPPLRGDVGRDGTGPSVSEPHPETPKRRKKSSKSAKTSSPPKAESQAKARKRSNAKTQSKPAPRSKSGPRATAVAKVGSKKQATPATRSQPGKRTRVSNTAPDAEPPPVASTKAASRHLDPQPAVRRDDADAHEAECDGDQSAESTEVRS